MSSPLAWAARPGGGSEPARREDLRPTYQHPGHAGEPTPEGPTPRGGARRKGRAATDQPASGRFSCPSIEKTFNDKVLVSLRAQYRTCAPHMSGTDTDMVRPQLISVGGGPGNRRASPGCLSRKRAWSEAVFVLPLVPGMGLAPGPGSQPPTGGALRPSRGRGGTASRGEPRPEQVWVFQAQGRCHLQTNGPWVPGST